MTDNAWKYATFIVLVVALGAGVATHTIGPEALLALVTYWMKAPTP